MKNSRDGVPKGCALEALSAPLAQVALPAPLII